MRKEKFITRKPFNLTNNRTMTLFRSKENGKLYTIERVLMTMTTDRNQAAGIYATAYRHNGKKIIFRSKDGEACREFVETNFETIGEL